MRFTLFVLVFGDLLAQKTDVAIPMGNLPDSALLAKRLGQSRRVVYAAPGYLKRKGTPKTPEELRDHDYLTFNFRRTRSNWPFREKGRMIDQPISGSVQVNNGETMKQMMLAGAGIGRVGLYGMWPPKLNPVRWWRCLRNIIPAMPS